MYRRPHHPDLQPAIDSLTSGNASNDYIDRVTNAMDTAVALHDDFDVVDPSADIDCLIEEI